MTSNNDQLYDLSNKASRSTIAVIDAVTQRGGFKGEELSTIGGLRDQCIQIVQLCETLSINEIKYFDSNFAFSKPICLIPKAYINLSNEIFFFSLIEYFKLSGGESTDGGKTYAPSVKTKISKAEYDSMMGPKKKKMMGIKKKKMAMGGRMGSKEMMESMKKDDKMLKNGGKVGDPKKKRKTGELISDSKDKSVPKKIKGLETPFKKVIKGDGDGYLMLPSNPPKYKNMKTKEVISESEYYKRTGKKKPKSGIMPLKYGGAMKKAMYGAKMKKKAMYGAKMKKK